jgi:hypothetical protein
MRKALRAVVVAAVIALPFTLGASSANAAECTPENGVVQLCGMSGAGIDIPGVIHVCIRIASNPCGT